MPIQMVRVSFNAITAAGRSMKKHWAGMKIFAGKSSVRSAKYSMLLIKELLTASKYSLRDEVLNSIVRFKKLKPELQYRSGRLSRTSFAIWWWQHASRFHLANLGPKVLWIKILALVMKSTTEGPASGANENSMIWQPKGTLRFAKRNIRT